MARADPWSERTWNVDVVRTSNDSCAAVTCTVIGRYALRLAAGRSAVCRAETSDRSPQAACVPLPVIEESKSFFLLSQRREKVKKRFQV